MAVCGRQSNGLMDTQAAALCRLQEEVSRLILKSSGENSSKARSLPKVGQLTKFEIAPKWSCGRKRYGHGLIFKTTLLRLKMFSQSVQENFKSVEHMKTLYDFQGMAIDQGKNSDTWLLWQFWQTLTGRGIPETEYIASFRPPAPCPVQLLPWVKMRRASGFAPERCTGFARGLS